VELSQEFFPMVSFGITSVESSDSASRKLINKVDGRYISYGDVRGSKSLCKAL